jgi:hypothetical protein
MKNGIVLFFNMLFISSNYSFSQKSWELNLDSEIPIAEMSFIYKPFIGLRAAFNFKDTDKLKLGVGFHMFFTKEDTFYYFIGASDYGKIRYSNYVVIPMFLNIEYKLNLSAKLDMGIGADLGLYHVFYKYHNINYIENHESTTLESKGLLAPKLSLNYKLNDDWSIGLHSILIILQKT